MALFDAHNHLQDACFREHLGRILSGMPAHGIEGCVVNGTSEADWPAVAELCRTHDRLLPSFGIHPWQVHGRTPVWQSELEKFLHTFPTAGVGEIGLDRWIPNPDIPAQTDVFKRQLALAADGNRPATIHCLKAWGALAEIVRSERIPERGFLLHAYSGSAEMVSEFAEHGAYFSFSTYFLHENKASRREVFRRIPLERILVETDAPSMAPPALFRVEELPAAESGAPVNHPFNLVPAYRQLALLLEVSIQELTAKVSENYHRLFVDQVIQAPDISSQGSENA